VSFRLPSPPWGIVDAKVAAVTTDGAGNMHKAIDKVLHSQWVYCASHALNLVVHKGMQICYLLHCVVLYALLLSS